MSKEKLKKIIYLALILIWMLTVFMFSNQKGEESQKTSNTVTEVIMQILTQNKNITEEHKQSIVENVDYIIRKFAHFNLYVIGGLLIFNYINTFDIKPKKKILISIVIGILYAVSDEFHQYFVPERSAQILDVCIDSLGGTFGVMMMSVARKVGDVYEYKGIRND